MSSGTSQITLSTPRPTKNSVTVLATTQTVYETGQIVIYDSSSIEVARSTTRTVASQSSLDIDVYGLLPGNEYTAKFYNEDNMDFSSSTVGFTTLEDNKLYGGVSGTVAKQVMDLYGGSNNGAQRITKLYGSLNGQTKLIHQGFGHLNYLILSSVTGSIVPWAGEGINVGSFNGNTFYTKLSADFPQFLPYSYCNAPIYRLKMVLKSDTYPYLADLILQFGGEGNIVAEEILENDVRPRSVFDDYGIDVNGSGGGVGAASYIYLNPIYN